MTKHVLTHGRTGMLRTAVLIAAVLSACTKDPATMGGEGNAVEFSAYARSMTKAEAVSASDVLGSWNAGSTVFTPGSGIGVFAFYQKAKSNGYPNHFNKNAGAPNFMSNQKVERTVLSGTTLHFTYSPAKYWPNNANDLLSFFAYAPYDITTAWEDLKVESNLKGDKITRHYELETACEDQTDFLWSDPVLNLASPGVGSPVSFNFRHICARIGASCRISYEDADNVFAVKKLVVKAKFNVSGDIVYRTATGNALWENLERSYHVKEYVLYNAGSAPGQTITTGNVPIGGDGAFLFPFPGSQDITVVATVTQSCSGCESSSFDVTHTFADMNLEEGRAYNFLLDITLRPIEIGSAVVAEWSADTETPATVK